MDKIWLFQTKHLLYTDFKYFTSMKREVAEIWETHVDSFDVEIFYWALMLTILW